MTVIAHGELLDQIEGLATKVQEQAAAVTAAASELQHAIRVQRALAGIESADRAAVDHALDMHRLAVARG